jgi:hypothetical protein
VSSVVFMQANRASVSNYKPVSIVSAFTNISESFIRGHIFVQIKTKLNSSEISFTKTSLTTTNLITILDIVSVCS